MRSPRVLLIMAGILVAGVAAPQDRTALFSSLDAASLVGKPVTNWKWEQVARVDSVLLDLSTGRITFFVLSFVDGNERVALPFKALSLDTQGRVRLVSRKAVDEDGVPMGALSSVQASSPALDAHPLPGEEPAAVLGFMAQSARGAILQGRVTGRMSLPDEAGRRRVKLMVHAGAESVSVDLGREEALSEIALAPRPGDTVYIEGRKVGDREFEASMVRLAGASFRIP